MKQWLWAGLATAIIGTPAQDCFEDSKFSEPRVEDECGKMRFAFFAPFVVEDSVLEAGADAEALRLLQGRAARRCWGSVPYYSYSLPKLPL